MSDNYGLNRDDILQAKNIKQQCCNRWTNKIGHNLESIMKVMRFAMSRGKSIKNKKYQNQLDLNTMIPWCKITNHGKQRR